MPLLLLPLLFPAPPAGSESVPPSPSPHLFAGEDDVPGRARKLLAQGDPQAAAKLLADYLRHQAGDSSSAALYGEVLLKLERRDEAAHWLAGALAAEERSGGSRRTVRRLEKLLGQADPLTRTRAGMLDRAVTEFLAAAEKLEKKGQGERALELLGRIAPIAVDPDKRREIDSAIDRIRSRDASVDLDSHGDGAEDPTRPEVRVETPHYRLQCALEPEVVDQLAVTVEDIYSGFVDVYFGGDTRRAPKARVTIHIHATWDDMAAFYPGGAPSPGVQGWWASGSNEIHAYDARTRGGSLDDTLITLLHEGSHQFMSTFAGATPAWINEGTACFFEGSTVMVDGRLLWPEAAESRLTSLVADLTSKPRRGPREREVIAFSGQGSYSGAYYPHGWGLVYFLQQWEDPRTLEYAYRPLYRKLIDRYSGKGSASSLRTFEEVMLGPGSPLGHTDLDAFLADWRRWLLEEVLPFYQGPQPARRELRLARATRYLDAADGKAGREVTVPAEELLRRALGELESLRRESPTPDKEVLLRLADVLERLDRPRTAAAMLDQLLSEVDAGTIAMEPEEVDELTRRMEKLDRGNWSLSTLRRKERLHARKLRGLIQRYRSEEPELALRAYTLASVASALLPEDAGLSALASELRAAVKDAGHLMGRIVPVAGKASAWRTVFSQGPESFRVEGGAITLSSVRPVAMIDTSVTTQGEYTLRAHLAPNGEQHLGTSRGVVVAGTPTEDWVLVGIDEDGNVGLWAVRGVGRGSVGFKYLETLFLDQPLEEGAACDLSVHVLPTGVLQIQVDEEEPVETELDSPPDGPQHVGVFTRDGGVRVEGLTLEIIG